MNKNKIAFPLITAFLLCGLPLHAQEMSAKIPASLAGMKKEGASITFLGQSHGLNGWLIRKQSQAQTVYSTPDGRGLVIGLLYDDYGNAITEQQLTTLDRSERPEKQYGEQREITPEQRISSLTKRLLEAPGFTMGVRDTHLSSLRPPSPTGTEKTKGGSNIVTSDIITSVPAFHIFMDPRCPYCHALWNEALPLIKAGKVSVHVIPVGILGEASVNLAASILGAPGSSGLPDLEKTFGKGRTLHKGRTLRKGPSDGIGPANAWQRIMDNRQAQPMEISSPLVQAGIRDLASNNTLFADWRGKGVPLLVYGSAEKFAVLEGMEQGGFTALVNALYAARNVIQNVNGNVTGNKVP